MNTSELVEETRRGECLTDVLAPLLGPLHIGIEVDQYVAHQASECALTAGKAP
jgi:hypothetical protein